MTIDIKQLAMDIIPSEYKPGAYCSKLSKASMPTLTHVEPSPKERISNLLKKLNPQADSENSWAICVNWGGLQRRANSKNWKNNLKSWFILIDKDKLKELSVLEVSFILLHEVGHIHWSMCPEERLKWSKGSEELFADMYAHDQLKKLHGDFIASKILTKRGSAKGFGQMMTKENRKCLM